MNKLTTVTEKQKAIEKIERVLFKLDQESQDRVLAWFFVHYNLHKKYNSKGDLKYFI